MRTVVAGTTAVLLSISVGCDAGTQDASTDLGGSDVSPDTGRLNTDAFTPDSAEPDLGPATDASPTPDGWQGPALVGGCGAADVYDLNAVEAQNEVRTLTVQLGASSQYQGRCGPPGSGADVVFRFTAPNDGTYEFVAEGDGFETTLFGYSDCQDDFSALPICSTGSTSQVSLQLVAGQTAFIVADRVDAGSGEVSLTLRPSHASVPVVSELLFVKVRPASYGVRISASDPDQDVVQAHIVIRDLGGEIIQERALIEENWVEHRDGDTHIIEIGGWVESADFARLGSVEVVLGDAEGLQSEVALATAQEAARIEIGGPCGPFQLFSDCGPDAACIGDPRTCQQVSAPTIIAANLVRESGPFGAWIGVSVTASDPDGDVEALGIVQLGLDGTEDDFGNDLFVSSQTAGETSNQTLIYRPFLGVCPSLDAATGDCVRAGGNARDCADEALEAHLRCEADKLLELRGVRLTVWDSTGRGSAPVELEFDEPALVDPAGLCDPTGFVNTCGDLDCAILTPDGTSQCVVPALQCPDWFQAVEIDGDEAGLWHHEGNSEDSVVVGGGSCGGGGPTAVHLFTAPAAGNYLISTDGTAGDTVLYVRAHCAVRAQELACNDDVEQARWSEVTVALEADQQISIFVDGYAGFAGPYTLQVSQR